MLDSGRHAANRGASLSEALTLVGCATLAGFTGLCGHAKNEARIEADETRGVTQTVAARQGKRNREPPSAEMQAKLEELLRRDAAKTASGREALQTMEKYSVAIRFERGKGSSYSRPTNTMTMDADTDRDVRLMSLVHEAVHARHENDGSHAASAAKTRDEFIRDGLVEEAAACESGFVAWKEIRAVRRGPEEPNDLVYEWYAHAYERGVGMKKVLGRAATPEEVEEAGRRQGRERLVRALRDGEIIWSQHKKTYPEALGEMWDFDHAKKP
jgi:hypothetical protein